MCLTLYNHEANNTGLRFIQYCTWNIIWRVTIISFVMVNTDLTVKNLSFTSSALVMYNVQMFATVASAFMRTNNKWEDIPHSKAILNFALFASYFVGFCFLVVWNTAGNLYAGRVFLRRYTMMSQSSPFQLVNARSQCNCLKHQCIGQSKWRSQNNCIGIMHWWQLQSICDIWTMHIIIPHCKLDILYHWDGKNYKITPLYAIICEI